MDPSSGKDGLTETPFTSTLLTLHLVLEKCTDGDSVLCSLMTEVGYRYLCIVETVAATVSSMEVSMT